MGPSNRQRTGSRQHRQRRFLHLLKAERRILLFRSRSLPFQTTKEPELRVGLSM